MYNDTENITLPDELIALTELIAENVHRVWAVHRLAEGWTYAKETGAAIKLQRSNCILYD